MQHGVICGGLDPAVDHIEARFSLRRRPAAFHCRHRQRRWRRREHDDGVVVGDVVKRSHDVLVRELLVRGGPTPRDAGTGRSPMGIGASRLPWAIVAARDDETSVGLYPLAILPHVLRVGCPHHHRRHCCCGLGRVRSDRDCVGLGVLVSRKIDLLLGLDLDHAPPPGDRPRPGRPSLDRPPAPAPWLAWRQAPQPCVPMGPGACRQPFSAGG